MAKPIDISGKKYNLWTVLDYVGKGMWNCVCDCGTKRIICGSELRLNRTKSCGCLHRKLASQRMTKHNCSHTRLYRIWTGMKIRCFDKNDKAYKKYGGRGIIVCNEWRNDFKAFYD